MSYLTARRHGLTHTEPTETERAGGWRQVWEHPSGLRALRHPVTGRWHVSDGWEIVGGGYSSSLRAVAARIARLAAVDDRPPHRPAAPDAPIPGRHWYGGCDPDLPRVDATGVCEGCGGIACPDCGYERYPDGACRCPS